MVFEPRFNDLHSFQKRHWHHGRGLFIRKFRSFLKATTAVSVQQFYLHCCICQWGIVVMRSLSWGCGFTAGTCIGGLNNITFNTGGYVGNNWPEKVTMEPIPYRKLPSSQKFGQSITQIEFIYSSHNEKYCYIIFNFFFFILSCHHEGACYKMYFLNQFAESLVQVEIGSRDRNHPCLVAWAGYQTCLRLFRWSVMVLPDPFGHRTVMVHICTYASVPISCQLWKWLQGIWETAYFSPKQRTLACSRYFSSTIFGLKSIFVRVLRGVRAAHLPQAYLLCSIRAILSQT